MDKVYVIQYDYSTEDCDGVDVYLYKDLDKAFEKFKNMIQEELAFYKEYYSSDEEEFELDTNIDDDKATEFYWNYKYINDYYVHTFLDLKIKEIL